jgi:hypothetical protein
MIYEITSIEDPRIAPFCKLTEAQLRHQENTDQGIFIAESPESDTCRLTSRLRA